MTSTGKRFKVTQFKIGNYKALVICEEDLQEAAPLIRTALLNAVKFLETDNDIIINVSSTAYKFVRDKMDGVSGYSSKGYAIFLSINSEAKLWKKFIGGTVAHEYNHAVRFQKINHWTKRTLLNSLVLEGLAQCFEEEVTGNLRPWSKAITTKQANLIWTSLKRKLNVDSRDLEDSVFFGKGSKKFPMWAGYTIGYLIVKKRRAELGETDWNVITGKDAKMIVGKEKMRIL